MTSEEESQSEYNRRLFRRVVLSFFDLSEARSSAKRLRELDEFGVFMPNQSHDFVAHSMCLIVSYARPFTRNHGADTTLAALPDEVRQDYSPEEHQLHDRLIELRNREFAHSDPRASELRVTTRKIGDAVLAVPSSRPVRRSLTLDEVDMTDHMIGLALDRLDEYLTELPESLPLGDWW